MANKEGNLRDGYNETYTLRSMADWYGVRALDISGESGDVEIATKYDGLVCKAIGNLSTSAATVKFKTVENPTETITFPLTDSATSPKLPPIKTIVQSGTSDSLLLYFQKR